MHVISHELFGLSAELANVGEREVDFRLQHARGEEFHDGPASAKCARSGKKGRSWCRIGSSGPSFHPDAGSSLAETPSPRVTFFARHKVEGRDVIEYIQFRNSNLLAGIRAILPSDEQALLPSEAASLGSAVSKVRCQSGAARIIARALLAKRGFLQVQIPRSQTGPPIWPQGIVGSLAHHDTVAAAAIAGNEFVGSLGIDIEPHEPLPSDLIDIITTKNEKKRYSESFLQERYIFVLKEAVYKAYFPIFKTFIDFHDIEIDIHAGIGRVVGIERVFTIEMIETDNIIGVAHLNVDSGPMEPTI